MDINQSVLNEGLEATRQEHEAFLAEVEAALVFALHVHTDEAFDQVLGMIDSYNPESKDYAGI